MTNKTRERLIGKHHEKYYHLLSQRVIPISHRQRKPKEATATHKPVILLAEDSITTRTQEKRILTSAGYEVVTAVDGLDAFNKLKTRNFVKRHLSTLCW